MIIGGNLIRRRRYQPKVSLEVQMPLLAVAAVIAASCLAVWMTGPVA